MHILLEERQFQKINSENCFNVTKSVKNCINIIENLEKIENETNNKRDEPDMTIEQQIVIKRTFLIKFSLFHTINIIFNFRMVSIGFKIK